MTIVHQQPSASAWGKNHQTNAREQAERERRGFEAMRIARSVTYVAAGREYAQVVMDHLATFFVHRFRTMAVRCEHRVRTAEWAEFSAAVIPAVARVEPDALAMLETIDDPSWISMAGWFKVPTPQMPEPLGAIGELIARPLVTLLSEYGMDGSILPQVDPERSSLLPRGHNCFDPGRWPSTVDEIARWQEAGGWISMKVSRGHEVLLAWNEASLAARWISDVDIQAATKQRMGR